MGCNPDARNQDSRTALHVACSEGRVAIVNELLASQATVDIADRWGNTPLRDAVSVGHTVIAGILVGKGGKLHLDEREASSELCKRARIGDLEGIRLLLSCKIDANAVDYDGRSCLHLAASEGSMHVLRELLTHGVNKNCRDRWNGTALADAVRNGHRQCAVELHKAGGELAFDEARAASELNALARAGDLEGIKLLIECGADAKASGKLARLNARSPCPASAHLLASSS